MRLFRKKNLCAYAAIAALVLLRSPSHVFAQSPSFTIAPVKIFTDLRRGEIQNGAFEISNASDDPLPLQVVLSFFGVKDGLGTIDFAGAAYQTNQAGNPRDWLSVKPSSLLLGPRETRSAQYSISVPADVPLGTFAVAAQFQSKFPDQDSNSPGARLLPAIGSLFFIDVVPAPGEPLPAEGSLRLQNFSLDRSNMTRLSLYGGSVKDTISAGSFSVEFVEKSPIKFDINLQNEAKYLARPRGTIVVKDILGRQVGEAVFPEGAVFPAASRIYSVALEKPQRFAGLGFLPDFIRNSFFPGRYTAVLSFASDAKIGVPNDQELVFWAFPRLFVLSTILPLTLMLLFVVLYRRRIISAIKIFIWQKP
jgi:hypothetical protein